MPEEHYNEFKKNSTIRDEYKTKAEVKKANASKLPIIGWLDNWLAKRHEKKAQEHQDLAYQSAEKHAKALKKKHKL